MVGCRVFAIPDPHKPGSQSQDVPVAVKACENRDYYLRAILSTYL